MRPCDGGAAQRRLLPEPPRALPLPGRIVLHVQRIAIRQAVETWTRYSRHPAPNTVARDCQAGLPGLAAIFFRRI